jgi:hypothetical protein
MFLAAATDAIDIYQLSFDSFSLDLLDNMNIALCIRT